VKPCLTLNGYHLPDEQQAYLADLLQLVEQNDFSREKLEPCLPAIVRSFSEICPTDDELSASFAKAADNLR